MKTTSRMLILTCGILVALAALYVLRSSIRGPREAGELTAAFDAEFLTRPDGYLGLRKHYGLTFPSEPKQMDPGLMYRAIADGAVDVIDGFATDGRIPAYSLTILEDDKKFFPPYYAAPVIRADTLQDHPELRELLNKLAGIISDGKMRKMNYEADEEGQKASAVAREFLLSEKLIEEDAEAGDGSGGSITVGSKHFTEQEILGEIVAILIEQKTDLRVKRKLNLGGTMICCNALKAGDLDIYVEYTGTGLVNILDREVISDPEKAYNTVRTEFEEKYGLIWLEPLGFNNTYTLTMRADHAAGLGIETISELAAYVNRSGEP